MIVLIIYVRQFKVNVWWLFDRVAIVIPIVAAFVRFGNLMNSEIYGNPTTLPWGFIFERNHETVAKHPTQIYESLSYLFTFGVLWFMYWKTKAKSYQGLLTGVFFVCVFGTRFCIEFIKEVQESFEKGMSLDMGQWLSIPFILTGAILIILALKKGPKIIQNQTVTGKK